jgi:hypothetical protein
VPRDSPPSVVFYISGHGFGHASRQIEIINALGALRPDVDLVVRTAAPQWLFDRRVLLPLTVVAGECDTGVVQIDSLRMDEQATIETAAAFYHTLSLRAEREADFLREHDARLVVSDAPPLACVAAALAGVPSIVISNFTWDWIYEAFADRLADVPALLSTIRAAYRHAAAGWRLPMYGGFATIDTLVDLPLVAARAQHDRETVRHTLGLPLDRHLVLASFGGVGVNNLDVIPLDCLERYGVVFTSPGVSVTPHEPGTYVLSESEVYREGMRYTDLVSASDIIVTKPGYGIVSECIAAGCAVLYTSRGRFAEYDVLVAAMPRYLRCEFIDHDALFAGRWLKALDTVTSRPTPPEKPTADGAQAAAAMISARLT